MAGASFGVVDHAVKSITPVQEYIRVGMDITNEVALGFMENGTDDKDGQMDEFRDVMMDFVKMERELAQFQEAVSLVKDQARNTTERIDLEAVLDETLENLKKGNKDSTLKQHEKLLELNQKMWETIHPDEPYTGQLGAVAKSDGDVEMSQAAVITRCPYTGKEMVVPVKNKICGHNYEKAAILDYIKQRKRKAKCPLGGCLNDKPLDVSDLEENRELKRHIERKNKHTSKKHR